MSQNTNFTLTQSDIGRYVRCKSSGRVGRVCRDPGNGWLHVDELRYEWRGFAADLEFVTVTIDARPKFYEHFKGGIYRLLRIVAHEKTLQPLVIYESVKNGDCWARDKSDFFAELPDGKQRFKFLGD